MFYLFYVCVIWASLIIGTLEVLNIVFGRMFANFIARCLKSNRAWR